MIDRIGFTGFNPESSIHARDGARLAQGVVPYKGQWRETFVLTDDNGTGLFQAGTGEAGDYGSNPRSYWFSGSPDVPAAVYYTIYNSVSTRRELREADAGTSTNVSKGGTGYSGVGHSFDFATFGDWLLAAALDVDIQARTTTGNFGDLISSGDKPKGRFIISCRGRAVLGNVDFSGLKPRRVWWSKRNDATVWTPGPLPSDPGFLDIREGGFGEVSGLVGFDDFFLVFFERGVERWGFVGGDTVWQRRQVGKHADGMLMDNDAIAVGRDCYYPSQSGFKVIRGGDSIEPIDRGVSRIFMERQRGDWSIHRTTRRGVLRGAELQATGVIFWSWLTVGGKAACCVYNYDDNMWSVLRPITDLGAEAWNGAVHMVCSADLYISSESRPLTDAFLVTGKGGEVMHNRFSGGATGHTMPILMRSHRPRLAEDALEALVRRFRAEVDFLDAADDSAFDPTPLVRLHVHRGDGSDFKNVRTTVLSNAEVDQDGFFKTVVSGSPPPLKGNYFQFEVEVPSYQSAFAGASDSILRELTGVQYEVQEQGRGR